MTTLAWLAEHPDEAAFILTTPESLLQRIPSISRLLERSVRLAEGQTLDLAWLETTLEAFGYELVERVGEPGEAALHASTADIFPAGATAPIRLEIADNTIRSIRRFAPDDQLSVADLEQALLLPASERFTIPGEDMGRTGRVAERLLPDGPLSTIFDLLPYASFGTMEGADQRIEDWLGLIRDGYNVALASLREGTRPPRPPDTLYLGQAEIASALSGRRVTGFALERAGEPALSIAMAARRAAVALLTVARKPLRAASPRSGRNRHRHRHACGDCCAVPQSRLVVIDEEQRFGEAQKRALREKRASTHVLIMTATPLPRTLQAALIGIVGVSVLAQPPAARLPVRSVVVPFDPVVACTALMREARRGGQSFVVCPRIEDLAPMQQRLQEIVPELSIAVAHGRMRGEAVDRIVLDFAGGEADVLLTTSIVEAGLDIPSANTMLIWRADRFGLAQLHQLRGRIGRGRERASAYLLTDPAHPPSAAAQKRLTTIGSLNQLGAGFDLSLADLEQRGAGDLLGEEQAGHLRLIGTELYRYIFTRAVARARGEGVTDEWSPAIVASADAFVPEHFVPEPDVRLEIYRRLARAESVDILDELASELDDRFGALPRPLATLLDIAKLRLLSRQHGIAALHAGPQAIALASRGSIEDLLSRFPDAHVNGERVIVPLKGGKPEAGLKQVLAVLSHDATAR